MQTNVDHRTPEALAFICKQLLEKGALDVWQEAIQMKKGRLGIKLNLLCAPSQAAEFSAELLAQTGSLGVRASYLERTVLPRRVVELDTPYGKLPFKAASLATPSERQFWLRPEHDAVAELAQRLQKDYQELYDELLEIARAPSPKNR